MDVVLPSVHLGTPTVVATVYPQLVTGRVPEKGERGGGGGVPDQPFRSDFFVYTVV